MPEKSDYMLKRLLYLAGLRALEQPENEGKLVFIQHDTTPGRIGHGKTYSSLPETLKQLYDRKFDISPGSHLYAYIQSILHSLNPWMNTKDFDREWTRLFKHDTAFSNKGDGTQMENLYCGGATFMTTGRTRMRLKVQWTEVFAIDPKSLPGTTMPTLLFQPVINTIEKVPGSMMTKKIPFPMFNGNIYLPLLAVGGNAWVRNAVLLPDDKIPSPFFP